MPNFFKAIVVVAVVLMSQDIQPVAASEPIAIRGVHWAMSTNEQIVALENNGLTCLQRDNWSVIPPSLSGPAKVVQYVCIESDTPTETTRNLDQFFKQWETQCQRGRSNCWGWDGFKEQFEKTRRVTVKADDRIIFHCSYLKTCGFNPNDIVKALQQRVHPGPWERPVEDSFILCTTGPIKEALCVHWHSKDVWLMKSSLTSKMDF